LIINPDLCKKFRQLRSIHFCHAVIKKPVLIQYKKTLTISHGLEAVQFLKDVSLPFSDLKDEMIQNCRKFLDKFGRPLFVKRLKENVTKIIRPVDGKLHIILNDEEVHKLLIQIFKGNDDMFYDLWSITMQDLCVNCTEHHRSVKKF